MAFLLGFVVGLRRKIMNVHLLYNNPIFQTDIEYLDTSLLDDEPSEEYISPWRRRAIVYMTLINCGKSKRIALKNVLINF